MEIESQWGLVTICFSPMQSLVWWLHRQVIDSHQVPLILCPHTLNLDIHRSISDIEHSLFIDIACYIYIYIYIYICMPSVRTYTYRNSNPLFCVWGIGYISSTEIPCIQMHKHTHNVYIKYMHNDQHIKNRMFSSMVSIMNKLVEWTWVPHN